MAIFATHTQQLRNLVGTSGQYGGRRALTAFCVYGDRRALTAFAYCSILNYIYFVYFHRTSVDINRLLPQQCRNIEREYLAPSLWRCRVDPTGATRHQLNMPVILSLWTKTLAVKLFGVSKMGDLLGAGKSRFPRDRLCGVDAPASLEATTAYSASANRGTASSRKRRGTHNSIVPTSTLT